jgi:NAD(P)-dependent dehydrogenase (short-subunit alcohol dehydrogenase family)
MANSTSRTAFTVMKLKDRIALVVGGGTGLGRAIALALANEGAFVAVADRDLAAAQATTALFSTDSPPQAYWLDIIQTDAIRDTVGAVVKRFGRLDIMVNCAAICLVDPLLELTPERWEQVFAVNTRGAFFCMQAAAVAMVPNKFGRIITISTPASKVAVPLFATYGASKAAIDSLTKSAAIAWAQHGITVNTIAPGRMTGGMVDVLDRDLARMTGQNIDEFVNSRTKTLPMGRRVDPKEVAQAALWLASDDAAYVTGERFNFTGGQELQ